MEAFSASNMDVDGATLCTKRPESQLIPTLQKFLFDKRFEFNSKELIMPFRIEWKAFRMLWTSVS